MKPFSRFADIVERIADISGYFSGWLVPLMTLLILFEVIMRYGFRQPPVIADEISAYMLVGLSFLAIAYTWKEKGHVRVTALVSRLPPRVSSWIRLIALLLAFVFALALSQASYGLLVFSFKYHLASESHLHIPLQGPHMPLIIGFIILCLLLIVEIVRAIMKIRAGENIEEATT